ncbi:VIT1/CCC1 family protein [Oxyplasma meridianum]|uniref:VIT1/CCC1 family protein n=1 Tax=Oxyplasma meridianum TaxID=3073602 RepID=A0AAX4NDW0_9ARCH
MAESPDLSDQVVFYRNEITDMIFYDKLSRRVKDDSFRNSLIRLSETEKSHSNFWKQRLEKSGIKVDEIRPKFGRIRGLLVIRRLIGNYLSIKLLEHSEIDSILQYNKFLEDNRSDAEISNPLQKIILDEIEHEEVFSKKAGDEDILIQKNRDLIYGMSDGLVEVLASLAGLSGIISDHFYIALGGTVVGIGGAISMALGAYLSQKSESEYKINELTKKSILERKIRYGKKMEQYKGESKKSALNVGMSYVLGAVIPIIPFIFLPRIEALIVAVILVAASQGFSNMIVAITMGLRILRTSMQAMSLSLIAAAATFSVSYFFHIFFHITLI